MDENNPTRGWWSANWKWALPSIGCLSIIVVFVLLFGAMVTKVTGMFKDTVPYQHAMELVEVHPDVIAILGEPIETNGMFQGNINFSNDEGTADLKIPIKGPNGEATILVIAEKKGEKWTYETLEVRFEDTEEKINLLTTSNGVE